MDRNFDHEWVLSEPEHAEMRHLSELDGHSDVTIVSSISEESKNILKRTVAAPFKGKRAQFRLSLRTDLTSYTCKLDGPFQGQQYRSVCALVVFLLKSDGGNLYDGYTGTHDLVRGNTGLDLIYQPESWISGKTSWHSQEITFETPPEADFIVYGINIYGPGSVYIAEPTLQCVAKAVSVTRNSWHDDLGFE